MSGTVLRLQMSNLDFSEGKKKICGDLSWVKGWCRTFEGVGKKHYEGSHLYVKQRCISFIYRGKLRANDKTKLSGLNRTYIK